MPTLSRSLKAPDGQAGQSLVEYSLILCLVVVVLIVVLILLGNQVQNMYCNIAGGIGA
ncbi:MAG: Flp family type IVb pilin [Chloroflexi bacterium]|nr:MAG: Flp family type IVb pilin [Chloroflexota bacterium]